MKRCFKCGEEKPPSQFYKHKQMADGYSGKCKECAKTDSTEHRNNNLERIREYDRGRGSRQDPEHLKNNRKKYPNKYKATSLVNNAIRDKKLFKEPCEKCGATKIVHAHHDDYLKPLNVRWLCPVDHKQWHRDNGKGLNG